MSAQKKFEKNSIIFREGDYETCMYRILSGRVGVYRNFGTDDQILLTRLESGKIFGELGLIDYMPRSATVVAIEDTEVEVIEDAEFDAFLSQHTDEAFDILASINARVRVLTKEYEQVCSDLKEYASAEGLNVEPSLMQRIAGFVGFGKKYAKR